MASTIHNPSNFRPQDYEVTDYLDNKRPQWSGEPIPAWEDAIRFWEADMARVLGPDWRRKSHSCIHCGNTNVRWITAVFHAPSNDTVVFGSDCTNRLGFTDHHSFKLAQIMARAEARKVAFTIFNQRKAFLDAHSEVADALARIGDPVHAKNFFAHDVLSKLDQYGSLSTAQIEALVSSMHRDTTYAARKAAEDALPKGDAPTGRTAVTGLVVSIKEQESAYGVTMKMLVKLLNNSRVWLTAPADVEKGDTVTVKATWTPSKDDRSFGFGKRPILISRTAAA